LHVVSSRIRFHVSARERTRPKFRVCTARIGGRNAKRPSQGRGRRIRHDADKSERRLYALLRVIVSGQRKNIEDRDTAANSHFAVTARVPCETESRLKIACCGIRVIRSLSGAAGRSEDKGALRVCRAAVR